MVWNGPESSIIGFSDAAIYSHALTTQPLDAAIPRLNKPQLTADNCGLSILVLFQLELTLGGFVVLRQWSGTNLLSMS
jgi:hypothetical protein